MDAKEKTLTGIENEVFQPCCFYIGEALCGININVIQEINKDPRMTKVPLSSDYVVGIMNLRGQIVSVIDLGRKLGLSPSVVSRSSRVIIVRWKDENIGLLVDRITDVVEANVNAITEPPSNIKGVQSRFIQGVYHDKSGLIAILDISAILSEES